MMKENVRNVKKSRRKYLRHVLEFSFLLHLSTLNAGVGVPTHRIDCHSEHHKIYLNKRRVKLRKMRKIQKKTKKLNISTEAMDLAKYVV